MSLTEKQITAARMLFEGLSVPKIIEKVGVSEGTIKRWKNNQEVQALISQLSQQSIATQFASCNESQNRLWESLERVRQKAIARLEVLLEKPDLAETNEVALLRLAGKWSGLENWGDRIELQLDYLQTKMTPNAYSQLLIALSSNSSESTNGNGRSAANQNGSSTVSTTQTG